MKTSKKDLLRAYDALSSAILTTKETLNTVRRLPREQADRAIDLVQNAVASQRARGAALIRLTENASSRCGTDLCEMCERLIDKSTTEIGRALGL